MNNGRRLRLCGGGCNEQDAQLVLHTDSRLFDWPLGWSHDGLFILGASMTKDEALRLAWDALQQIAHVSAMDYEYQQWAVEAITAIKEALAQPEQEPVGEIVDAIEGAFKCSFTKMLPVGTKLYTNPPQRTWVGLTDEEILTYRHMIDWTAEWSYINFARAIEAAHGIKGEA